MTTEETARQVYTFFKTRQDFYLKCIHFVVCKFYSNKINFLKNSISVFNSRLSINDERIDERLERQNMDTIKRKMTLRKQ